jgi:hypothetical protein
MYLQNMRFSLNFKELQLRSHCYENSNPAMNTLVSVTDPCWRIESVYIALSFYGTCGMSLFVDNHYNRYSLLESQVIGKPGEALVGQLAGCRIAGPEKGWLHCS